MTRLWIVAVVVLLASRAQAQTPIPVTAASGVSFTDVDNAALNADGSPVIAYYEVRFVPGAACTAVPAVNIGKPTPDAQGVIVARPIAAFGTLTGNCVYTLFLAAVGPGGQGVSIPSDPFVRVVPRLPAGLEKTDCGAVKK